MNNDQVTNLLYGVLAIMIPILIILVIAFVVILIRNKRSDKKPLKEENVETETQYKSKISEEYNRQSIFSFMDFDKIEDNMIIRKNGKRYVMVVECQGINYDLMSEVEKTSVEQGFLQFLNTLRHPIQIYIQTRTVNLERSIVKYKDRLKEIEDRLIKEQLEYNSNYNSGAYGSKELEKQRIEVVKERNLYEYGKDIIENTERMSLNRNILSKHYYLVMEYIPEETETSNYDKDEIENMAFSELYTKAQSAISSLSVCGINSKILNSNQLGELLYMAYNRDESEIFELDKALEAGYEDLYSTAQDVLEKRMKALDMKIEEDAIKKANEKLFEVTEEREKEREVREKEERLRELISQMAKKMLKENENLVGKELAKEAIEKINQEEQEEKEEKTDDKKVKTRKKRTTRKVE